MKYITYRKYKPRKSRFATLRGRHEAPRSYFSWLLVFILVAFSVLPSAAAAQGATLSLSPASGNFGIGDDFSVMVRVHTGGVSINAAEATLNFPPDTLSVTSLSKSGSIFSLWTVEPTFSNSGIITLGGGTPSPFSGSSGTLLTINFKAKKAGEAQVAFSSGRILAADGRGTDIFGGTSGASYRITSVVKPPVPPSRPEVPVTPPSQAPLKPKIISLTHPNENAWYRNSNPEFSWILPKDATEVSFLLDRIPARDPDSRSEGLLDYKLYSDVEEGVKYFHLKIKNAYGWSEISHYRIQIDHTPPHPFEITVLDGKETDNPQPTILFDTSDDLSGIGYYEVKVGEDQKAATEKSGGNPFKIARQIPGTYTIVVKAFDKALNSSQAISEVTIKPIETPVVTDFTTDLFIGERLEVKGTGIAQAKIELHVSQNKKGTEITTATVDEKGDWFLTSDRFFISGPYSFYIIQEDTRGAYSMPSGTFDFRVQAFVNIGPWRVSSFVIALTLGLLFGLSIIGAILVTRKMRGIRKGVRDEASDAKKKLHRSVDRLKEQITARLKELERARQEEGRFSDEEAAVAQKLKNDLDKLELSMKKEITDIEGELNHIANRHKQNWAAKLMQKINK